jgi:hypothetical protein
MATTNNTTQDAPTEQFRVLNERIFDAARPPAARTSTRTRRPLSSVVEQQERTARQTDVEWLSSVIDAQARYNRELTKLWVNTGRELIK